MNNFSTEVGWVEIYTSVLVQYDQAKFFSSEY